MDATHPSILMVQIGVPPERKDEDESNERMNYVERELMNLRGRLDTLLAYVRQDDVAPLTPAVRLDRSREDRK